MILWSFIFGAIVGVSLGLTGGGGAIFAVPLLTYGLGIAARESVAISLISVGLTAFVGFLRKWPRNHVEVRTGLLFAVAGMLGAPVGSWVSRQVPEMVLMLMFAGLMLTIAARMWLKSSASGNIRPGDDQADALDGPSCRRDASGMLILNSRCTRLLLLVGIASGVLTGMFGVGGGFIIVPALVLFSGMSMLKAVGTSLMVISLVSVSGIASQLWSGQSIDWQTAGVFVPGSLAGLLFGQAVSHRLSASTLQRVFSVAILIVAAFVIFRNLA